MMKSFADAPVRSRSAGDITVVYAGDYLNKLIGERIERECKDRLEAGCRALVINFRDTELVNSIGVSLLLGIIDAAEKTEARVVFSDLNHHTIRLFELLGLTRYAALAENEEAALAILSEFAAAPPASGH